MEKDYHKLVRDNIPNIIEKNNETAITRTLEDEEYLFYLYVTLMEKCREVVYSNDTKKILEELTDIIEVVKSISEYENSSLEEVIENANVKRRKRGGFNKRILLEKTY